MLSTLVYTALVAAQLAVPTAADPDIKRNDVRVVVSDLDLGTPEGAAALDRRLEQAVLKACGTAYYLDPEGLNEVDRCRADARDRAFAARQALLGRGAGAATAVGASR